MAVLSSPVISPMVKGGDAGGFQSRAAATGTQLRRERIPSGSTGSRDTEAAAGRMRRMPGAAGTMLEPLPARTQGGSVASLESLGSTGGRQDAVVAALAAVRASGGHVSPTSAVSQLEQHQLSSFPRQRKGAGVVTEQITAEPAAPRLSIGGTSIKPWGINDE